jgi:nitrogen fixation-related uncharacterized protein
MDDLDYDAYDMDDRKSPGYAERILANADDHRDEQQTGGN